MCGRFSLTASLKALAALLVMESLPDTPPRFNIAPTQDIWVLVRDEDQGRWDFRQMRWGLVPAWTTGDTLPGGFINARSESVAEKPAFRQAFRRRRCWIPADGFFEWQAGAGASRKQPWYFRMADRSVFGFAGLWDTWTGGAGREVVSATLLTTGPNGLVRPVHDRMPVILPPGAGLEWILAADGPEKALEQAARPFAAGGMEAWPVSMVVNRAANDDPACVERVSGHEGVEVAKSIGRPGAGPTKPVEVSPEKPDLGRPVAVTKPPGKQGKLFEGD